LKQTAGLEVEQSAKPNQTSRTINKCSQKVGFIRKTFDTKISRHDTKIKHNKIDENRLIILTCHTFSVIHYQNQAKEAE